MQWQEVIDDPNLQDLPYKIELNEYGKIVMSPASNKHGIIQGYIQKNLWQMSGVVFPECSIQTAKGVKVADVVWCSENFYKTHGTETPYQQAPEICVEVISPSNSKQEMQEKIMLYLEVGAKEVWLVTTEGIIEYYNQTGEISRSNFDLEITEIKL
ncbi:MAG: Uma2 family endonuclease [Gammaproteobacteria bacterium]|nr:Uma2 family endonuclease [Gammaproteobacteria bacterium]